MPTETSRLKHFVSRWNAESTKLPKGVEPTKEMESLAASALEICKSNPVAEAEFLAERPQYASVLAEIKKTEKPNLDAKSVAKVKDE